MKKRLRSALKSSLLQRVPSVLISHVIAPFLNLREATRLKVTCSSFLHCDHVPFQRQQSITLPLIEWMCHLKRTKTLSRKNLNELKTNLDSNIIVCRHREFPLLSGYEKAKKWKQICQRWDCYGYLCRCNIRRFVPLIKKKVSGEDAIHQHTAYSLPCRCTTNRCETLANEEIMNHNIKGAYCWYVDPKRSDAQQFVQILNIIRTKLLVHEHGGLNNPLIVDWMQKVYLYDCFV